MKIKYKNKYGKRSILICKNCNEEFETLDIKIRQGGERFCCNQCYIDFRSANKQNVRQANIFHQKKHKYGLDKETYLNMFTEQNNKCAICNEEKKLCVDHNHDNNKVRGLLCQNCNRGLGSFKDSTTLLKNAIKYIQMFN